MIAAVAHQVDQLGVAAVNVADRESPTRHSPERSLCKSRPGAIRGSIRARRDAPLDAAGQRLGFSQSDVVFDGHAIECRINAENPYTFVPSPGRITQYHVAGGPGIRYDSHVYANYYVPPHYDSLVGKLIAYGDTREQAIARMRVALSEMVIEGIQTNIPLHQELMNDAAFIRGGVSIHFLEEKMAALKAIQAET